MKMNHPRKFTGMVHLLERLDLSGIYRFAKYRKSMNAPAPIKAAAQK
jgi:hypothetical protein